MDKLITYFIESPEKEFYVRELAKLAKKSPTTISSHLKEFVKNEVLLSEKKFNHLFFMANNENKRFKDLKLTYNIESLRNSGLIEYLEEFYNHPEAIVLFGSFKKAENDKKSDIDILVITPSKKEANLEKYEKTLGHKIQLFLHSNEDIKKLKIKNKELVNNWINGMVLSGFWEVLK